MAHATCRSRSKSGPSRLDVLSFEIGASPKMEARIIKNIPSLEKESLHDAADLHVPQATPPFSMTAPALGLPNSNDQPAVGS